MTSEQRSGYEESAAQVGIGLAGLVETVEIGPAPVAALAAGGRRRLRRRRAVLTGSVALVTAAVVGGGLLIGPGLGPAGRPGLAAAAGVAAGPSAVLSAGAVPLARNPLAPVRAVLAQGVVDGKEWKVWAALWPLATREQSLEQARMIWQEQHAAGSDLPEPTAAYVQQYWQSGSDVVNLYYTVDGTRLPYNGELTPTAPGPTPPTPTGPDGGLSGVLVGALGKGQNAGPVRVAALTVGPDVAKTVVTWADGSTSEPSPVTLGDSLVRLIGVPERQGNKARSIAVYGSGGQLLGTNTSWLS
ncbi:hypothetical protein OHV05_26580 [Kitasatospora sp. NBC_00070]|uniref:hypothetical protein n=1 Tax=Kitasatospora sp. NBC_00070 TaxID=2975962 RepID=UPI003247A41B